MIKSLFNDCSMSQITTKNNTSNFHSLEVVGRGSETQLQVGENLKKYASAGRGLTWFEWRRISYSTTVCTGIYIHYSQLYISGQVQGCC